METPPPSTQLPKVKSGGCLASQGPLNRQLCLFSSADSCHASLAGPAQRPIEDDEQSIVSLDLPLNFSSVEEDLFNLVDMEQMPLDLPV